MTKTRFNVVMRQQKVTKLVKALTGDRKPQVPEKTVSSLTFIIQSLFKVYSKSCDEKLRYRYDEQAGYLI